MHERLRLWTADGTWQRSLDEVIVKDDSVRGCFSRLKQARDLANGA